MSSNLLVICKEFETEFKRVAVSVRFYYNDGKPVHGNQSPYLGVTCSDFNRAIIWADGHPYIVEELTRLFPDGYTLHFKLIDIHGREVQQNAKMSNKGILSRMKT